MTEVDWLDANSSLGVDGPVLVIFLFSLAYYLENPSANGKREGGPVPEEISRTLLTKKKQGNNK
jgi:hypothetical protein